MNTLDNSPINLNDSVYDLVYGVGSVTSVTDTVISVKFKNGRTLSYDVGGRINGIRRLFWHDPLIIAPPKNKRIWDTFRRIVLDVYKLILLRE